MEIRLCTVFGSLPKDLKRPPKPSSAGESPCRVVRGGYGFSRTELGLRFYKVESAEGEQWWVGSGSEADKHAQ